MDNLTDKQLKWGYWWVLHRSAVKRTIIIFLSVICLGLVVYVSWQLVDWLTSRQAEEEALRQLVSQTINIEDYRRRNQPEPLQIGIVTAVPSSRGLYDLVAEVKNPNINWATTDMTVVFVADNQTFTTNAFFLPLEEKYIVKLGLPFRLKPQHVNVNFSDIQWQRVKNLDELSIPDFEISEQNIERVTPADSDSPTATRLTFKLTNASPFSYWQVGLTVVLSRGGSIQAVGRQILSNIVSQSTRSVEFYWPDSQIIADSVIVKPEVNVLDPRVLK